MSKELFDKSNDNRIRQNGLIMPTDEVVDLLNSQSKLISAYQYEFVKMRKENERLQKENNILNRNEDDLKECTLENEQLRHEIEIEKKWQLEKDDYYVKIKEENEELKKDNSLLRKYIEGCIKHRDLYRERLINGG